MLQITLMMTPRKIALIGMIQNLFNEKSQHWFVLWLGTIRKQANTRDNFDPIYVVNGATRP